MNSRWFGRLARCVCLATALVWAAPDGSVSGEGVPVPVWKQLLADAAKLRVPTQFLKQIPPDFIHFDYEDLHAYAAEYHPGEHRLVLNRTLSFNAAGRTLRPLTKLTHKELQVLYHELFHAYVDFLVTDYERRGSTTASPHPLLSFARQQQACRYGEVAITPIVQRPEETEVRYLTETESWEALNETWAVFVGWAIWHQLEIQQKVGGSMFERPRDSEQWILRLEEAVQKGELRGYYVPEDSDERRLTEKRFLAKRSQISGSEALVLMSQVLGFPGNFTGKLKGRPKLSSFFKSVSHCEDPNRE